MYGCEMRTTVDLDADTTKAIEQLRAQGHGLSEAVNELIRRGMLADTSKKPFTPRSQQLGLRIDVSNIAEAIDILEGSDAR